jgi:DNA-binding HxlR family transcriptional regulator
MWASKGLEADHLVKRAVRGAVPPAAEHAMTDLAQGTSPTSETLRAWGSTHRESARRSARADEFDEFARSMTNPVGRAS